MTDQQTGERVERESRRSSADPIAPPAWTETRPVARSKEHHPADTARHGVPAANEDRASTDQPDEKASHRETAGTTRDAKPAQTHGRPRWVWPALAMMLLVLGAGGYYGYRTFAKPAATTNQAAPRGIPVKVAEAKTGDLPLYLNSLGNVQAFNTVTIRSRVDGQILEIAFTEGQIVQKGDLLVQIDPRPYQAALDQALAKKAQDEATLANSERDLARTNQLGDFATRQQRDTQAAGINSQNALIAFDQAAIENAQTQLSYATIRAPLTGRTGLRLVDQGNIVRATDQTGIVEIAQLEPIAVLFTAPQQQLPDIAAAMKRGKVEVVAFASDGQTELATGELALINNAIDATSGTIRLKATFANTDEKLWPGLSVNTRLLVRTVPNVVSVPADAIQRGQAGMFVYVVGADDKAARRDVTVGPYTEAQAIIESGLRAGERVVVSGQVRLTVGSKVEIAPDPGAGTNGQAATPKPARVSEN